MLAFIGESSGKVMRENGFLPSSFLDKSTDHSYELKADLCRFFARFDPISFPYLVADSGQWPTNNGSVSAKSEIISLAPT